MLDDLRNIESKGFINPFSASGSPPLQLTMHVSKDSKQDTDKRRGELSSHLVYSLECHALAPLPAQESELASIADADSANRSRMSEGDETLVDSFLMTNDNLSATSNQDDYSTILMTCIALTSRAAGSFSITRSRVEFSIQCSVKAENSPYESEVRRSDTHEHPRATRELPLTARCTSCCVALHYVVLSYGVPYCTALSSTALHCTALYDTMRYRTLFPCAVPHSLLFRFIHQCSSPQCAALIDCTSPFPQTLPTTSHRMT